MIQNLEFKMPDGLIIKGQLEGNIDSDNLVVMLHSGGYDRHERGAKEITKDENGNRKIIYYNSEGNYDYLTNLLKHDYCILRIDQRNHGKSGKNINIDKITEKLNAFNVQKEDIQKVIIAEHARDKQTLNELINKYPTIKDTVNKPPLQNLSFVQMKDDLNEVMNQLLKTSKDFKTIDYVGTCMGTVVLGLYLPEHPEKANSLTLFSPLYTFDYSFINPPKAAELNYHKKQTVQNGQQFRLGNAIEGPSTYEEINQISTTFIHNITNLDIPIFCIQGTNDALVSRDEQDKLFQSLENYRKENNLNEIYYAEIEGVHCLYDSIFPSVLEVSTFIESNKKYTKQIK